MPVTGQRAEIINRWPVSKHRSNLAHDFEVR
jgi:hypothetical protein